MINDPVLQCCGAAVFLKYKLIRKPGKQEKESWNSGMIEKTG